MDRIEIRLLGPLRVRRSNGSLVDPREWRTHKTAELLMLLALHAGEPVPTHRLLAALWPDADPERGRASLRTALSRLRTALREDPFDRDPRGPVLSGVWVDDQVFDELAARAHRAWEQSQPDEVFAAATEADSLCLSHLVPDARGGWAADYGERHLATHRRLLGDAGEATLALLRPRQAAELADRLVALDPLHERACRTLMLAASAIGEVDRALQAYQACATRLADELGADPSSQTRAVYLHVLRAGPVAGRPIPFVGRDADLEALCAQLSRPGGGRMLIVHGEQGMGTTRLLEQALAGVGGEVVRGHGAHLSSVLETAARQHRETRRWPLLAVDRLDEADPSSLLALEELVLSGALALATCPTSTLGGPTALATALVRAGADGAVWKLRVPPLTTTSLRELASVMLAGEPGEDLVAQLLRLSRGRPGKAVALLEGWLARGSVVGSGRDLALVAPGTTSTAAQSRQILARMQERVAGPTYEVLEAAAALGDHASTGLLAAMTGLSSDQVEHAWDELTDLSVVTDVRGHLSVHDPLLRTVLLRWLRPSVRRALHRRAAGLEGLPHQARATHWRAADMPGEAASSTLAAAEELAAAGRLEQACELLRTVLEDGSELDPALRLHLAERLGDHLAQHGAGEAASRVYDSAVRDADQRGLGGIDRLAMKAHAPLGRHTSHLSVAEAHPSAAGPLSPVPDPHELEHQLRVRIESAQQASDRALAVTAQIELCAVVLTPQRRLDELAQVAAQAQFLAPTAQLRAQVVLAAAESQVLLGGASRWVSVLLEAVTTAPGDVSLATGLPPGRLLALAMHDLGQDGTVGVPREGGWLVSRILHERGDLSATAALRPAPTGGGQPCAAVLELLTRAQVVLADDRPGGRELLRQALDLSLGLGTGLLLPEVAARLAAEEVVEDEESALEHLDLAEFTLGEVAMPRERVLLLLGRAAVRAQHQGPRAAADVARRAAHIATRAGLVHLAHEAERAVVAYEQAPVVIALQPPGGEMLPRALHRLS